MNELENEGVHEKKKRRMKMAEVVLSQTETNQILLTQSYKKYNSFIHFVSSK